MLIEYTVTNFRSIRDEMGISMEVYSGPDVDPDRISEHDGLRLLRSAVIYGHNASGKSNLIVSLLTLKRLVLRSSKMWELPGDLISPFRFAETVGGTTFNVRFLHGREYRYLACYEDGRVTREELRADGDVLFIRRGDILEVGDAVPADEGDKIRMAFGMAHPHTLLLSKCSESNIDTTRRPYEWFNDCLLFPESDPNVLRRAVETDRGMFLEMLRNGDTGISDIAFRRIERTPRDLGYGMWDAFGDTQVFLEHRIYGEDGETAHQIYVADESAGTGRLMYLAAQWILTLRSGGVLVVDELERSLHPMLVDYLVRTVEDREGNPDGAQLIFSTHDVGIVERDGMRRDQVWITSRNPSVGCTEVYPFTNFDDKRSFGDLYMDSRLGGVPRIREGRR